MFKISNPKTGRMVNANGKIGKQIVQAGGAAGSKCTVYHAQPIACQAHTENNYSCVYTRGQYTDKKSGKKYPGQCRKFAFTDLEGSKNKSRTRATLEDQFNADAGNRLLRAYRGKKWSNVVKQSMEGSARQAAQAAERSARQAVEKRARQAMQAAEKKKIKQAAQAVEKRARQTAERSARQAMQAAEKKRIKQAAQAAERSTRQTREKRSRQAAQAAEKRKVIAAVPAPNDMDAIVARILKGKKVTDPGMKAYMNKLNDCKNMQEGFGKACLRRLESEGT
jgi:hypothetical protein